ncbi:MAG: dTDP-glucose 4,6-dehydratase [Candidatus Nanohaloarchaea archaeon]
MKFLVTGGAGFIGSNFVEHLIENRSDAEVVVLDKLTYAGEKSNIEAYLDEVKFVEGDIQDRDVTRDLVSEADVVVNFAAESHVDRSIESGEPFIDSNVRGAHNLMEVAVEEGVKKFVQISTDEVYGSLEEGKASEDSRLDPSSRYSATKASADMIANAMRVTHDLPVCTVRPTNNYGPRQHEEKLIPKFITRARNGEKLPLYGDGSNVRDWLYVKDNCRAIELVAEKGEPGEIYNVGAQNFRTNLEVTKMILDRLDRSEDLIEFVEDRAGHDQRYAVDTEKIEQLGWSPEVSFKTGIEKTIEHYT